MATAADSVALFRELLGADAVESGAGVRAFRVDDRTPQCVVFPRSLDELSRCVRAADAAAYTLIPVGNGTQLAIGRVPQAYDVAISTRRMRRLVAHEAADMTATVEAGLTLAALNAALAAAGQWLPLDPPHPEHTTIGAVIATDGSGPLRMSQGKVRDLLIGLTVVLADGTLVRGGGRVVKNVAGYDLMKLFTGSYGTLGIVAEATFKIRPRPQQEGLFVMPAADTRAAAESAMEILGAALTPLYVEALNEAAARGIGAADGAAVVVGCGGSAEEIAAQYACLVQLFGGSQVQSPDAATRQRLLSLLRDFPADGAVPDAPTRAGCRLSVLPSQLADVLPRIDDLAAQHGLEAETVAHVASGVATVRFRVPPDGSAAVCTFAAAVRALMRSADQWVVFDALPAELKRDVDPWGTDPPGVVLMRGIKDTLDPHHRLSPGRFVGGI